MSHWTLRELCFAVEAKRRDEYERLSYGIYWIVNSMPTFSNRRRPMIHLSRINPFARRRGGRRSGLTDDQIEQQLDRWAERAGQ